MLPSQAYDFDLARQAVAWASVIVVMRSYRSWISNVPELAEANHHELASKQNVTISARRRALATGEAVQRLA